MKNDHLNVKENTFEKSAEKIAGELKITLPAQGSPLLLRLVALFTLVGGLSILGSLFADIVRPPTSAQHFYLIRIVTGIIAMIISYEIIQKSKLAIWLYGVVVLTGLFINPIVSIFPLAVLIYLFSQRRLFKQSMPDRLIASLSTKIRR